MKINDILVESDNMDVLIREIINSPYYKNVMYPVLQQYRKTLPVNIENSDIDISLLVSKIPFLYHGSDSSYAIEKIKFTERESPRDTLPFIHDAVNELLNERFGRNVRNGMFGYKSKRMASGYGKPRIILPIGDYVYYYKWDVDDFTSTYSVAAGDQTGSDMANHLVNEVIQQLPYTIVDEVYNYLDFTDIEKVTSSFEEIYGNILEAFRAAIKKSKIPIDDQTPLDEKISDTLKEAVNEISEGIIRYARTVRETQSIDAVDDEEIITWFDEAYLIDPEGKVFFNIMRNILVNEI